MAKEAEKHTESNAAGELQARIDNGELPFPEADPVWNVLKQIEQAGKSPQPTPRIGAIVGWANQVAQNRVYRPAIVTRQLDPGRIDLQVFGDPTHVFKEGALFIANPEMLNQPGIQKAPNGWWFYLENLEDPKWIPPPGAYWWHKQKLAKRREAAIADAVQREERRLKTLELMEADAQRRAAATATG